MLKPLKIPRGVASVFMVGCTTVKQIDENYAHRPDKILDYYGMKSIGKEMVNNYMSNTSPISCKQGDEYYILNALFMSYFVR